jgi:hypothetical protein
MAAYLWNRGVFMSKMRVINVLLFIIVLTGCATVDKYAYEAERALSQQDGCQTKTLRTAPSYTTDASYRCVGAACSNYGCKE